MSKHFWCAAPALALAATLAHAAPAPERVYLDHPVAPNAPALPFSDAVRSGDTLYVAGHLGLDPKTGVAATDPATEAHLMMEAVKQTLARAGYTMDDLLSVTVYCTDLTLYDTFNSVYAGYFHGHPPARAFIGVAKLVRGARFELQGTAVRSGSP
ncbi:MAG TPA: Rid family hydrolase [Steroidobacteraceae bacterium]|nr:RidA family protein [Gammaproteobacteria bacterium]HEV2284507.1 Rid family hydrolase [Steroidobacteraceae bacterium]